MALLTLPEIVARFGTPTKVADITSKLRVSYLREDLAGERTDYVAFEFAGGRVSYLESNMDG